MEEKKTILTYAGLKALEDELENLRAERSCRKDQRGKGAGRLVGERRIRCSKR